MNKTTLKLVEKDLLELYKKESKNLDYIPQNINDQTNTHSIHQEGRVKGIEQSLALVSRLVKVYEFESLVDKPEHFSPDA